MSLFDKITRNVKDALVMGPGFPLRHLSALLGRKMHVTDIRGAGVVHMRTHSSDAMVLAQIFRDKEYDFAPPQLARVKAAYQRMLDAKETPVIIDAGANIGAASIWFAKQFPAAQIMAIEPDAGNAAMAHMNTGHLPRVKLIEGAIGSEAGQVTLSNPKNQAWSVRTTRSNEGGTKVWTITEILQSVPAPARLLLVKIDIEGFEEDLFAVNTGWLDLVEAVIIEPHDWLFPDMGKTRNFQKAFAARNFEMLISGENVVYVRMSGENI